MRRLWILGLLSGLLTVSGCPDFSDEDTYACEKDQDCEGLTVHTVCNTDTKLCAVPPLDRDGGADGGADGGEPDGGDLDGGADGGEADGGADGGTDGGEADGGTDGGTDAGSDPPCTHTTFTCSEGWYPCPVGCCEWTPRKVLESGTTDQVAGFLLRESLAWNQFGIHLLHRSDGAAGLWLEIFDGSTWTDHIQVHPSSILAAEIAVERGGRVWTLHETSGGDTQVQRTDPTIDEVTGYPMLETGSGSRGLSLKTDEIGRPTATWVAADGAGVEYTDDVDWTNHVSVGNPTAGRTARAVAHAFDAAGLLYLAWTEEVGTSEYLQVQRDGSPLLGQVIGELGADPSFFPPEVLLEVLPGGEAVVVVNSYTSTAPQTGIWVGQVSTSGDLTTLHTETGDDLSQPTLAVDNDGRVHVAWLEDRATIKYALFESLDPIKGPYSYPPSGTFITIDSLALTLEEGCNPIMAYGGEGNGLWLLK